MNNRTARGIRAGNAPLYPSTRNAPVLPAASYSSNWNNTVANDNINYNDNWNGNNNKWGYVNNANANNWNNNNANNWNNNNANNWNNNNWQAPCQNPDVIFVKPKKHGSCNKCRKH